MAAGGVSVDEPNKLPAHQAPPDWSWQILAVAVWWEQPSSAAPTWA